MLYTVCQRIFYEKIQILHFSLENMYYVLFGIFEYILNTITVPGKDHV